MSIRFARASDGSTLALDLHRDHTILAGQSRSGKSVTSYVLLAGASLDPTLIVVGVDPSSILLSPFAGAGQDGVVLGTTDTDLQVAVDLLAELVAIMDRRIAYLRRSRTDKLSPSAQLPTVRVVLEEYAGLLTACEVLDQTRKPAERLRPRVLQHVGRLLREGAKVQMLVVTIIQRPDAAIIGGADRAQYARRITHRLDNLEGVRMLNENADKETTERLMLAAPGVGLLNESGAPLRFFRSIRLDYRTYADCVARHYRRRDLGNI